MEPGCCRQTVKSTSVKLRVGIGGVKNYAVGAFVAALVATGCQPSAPVVSTPTDTPVTTPATPAENLAQLQLEAQVLTPDTTPTTNPDPHKDDPRCNHGQPVHCEKPLNFTAGHFFCDPSKYVLDPNKKAGPNVCRCLLPGIESVTLDFYYCTQTEKCDEVVYEADIYRTMPASGTTPQPYPKPDHCKNKQKDADESDVDCGGCKCEQCDVSQPCKDDFDCKSLNCENDVCVPPGPLPSCTDGKKNGDETGVDCGGPTCPKCDQDKPCLGDTDCLSGNCKDLVCRPPKGTCKSFGRTCSVGPNSLEGDGCRNEVTCTYDPSNPVVHYYWLNCGGRQCNPPFPMSNACCMETW